MDRDYLRHDSRGSYTVEAALIFSVIILVLSSLILSFMLMYQKILLTKTASAVAQKAADMWAGMRTAEGGLYRGAFADFRGETTYSEKVKGESDLKEKISRLQSEVRSGSLDVQEKIFKTMQLTVYGELSGIVRKPETTTVTFNYKDNLLSRDITVAITQEIKIPLGSLKSYFDGKDTLTLVGTGAAAMILPAQYVSDIDLFLEYAGKLKATEGLKKIQNWFKQ